MPRSPLSRSPLLTVAVLVSLSAAATAGPDDEAFFTDEVLPVLEARCFDCHGPDARRAKGKLRMEGRDSLLKGGFTGPAVVPGDLDGSLLVQAIRRLDEDLAMPPKEVLPEAERLTLEEWVRRDTPWPGGVAGEGASDAATSAAGGGDAGAGADAAHDAASAEPLPEFTPEAIAHFEREVRPLLVEHCFECHGPEVARPKGGLSLASRDGVLRGGLSGAAAVSGDPNAGLLLRAMRYEDADLAMPPDGALPQSAVLALAQWIRDGVPFPGGIDGAHHEEPVHSIEEGRSRWAFSPVVRPEVPGTRDGAGRPAAAREDDDSDDAPDAHPIDAFLDARLAEAGLTPNPPADRRALARRTYLDLIGIPPTKAELDAYLADDAADAHARLVDELLARPEHGERWARHWLDVVRYAQTNGYERDQEKPFAWRFRDWVIAAINSDVPYDRFLALQLAGDELPDGGDDGLIATGFYRLGTWDYEPDDARQAEFDELDDVVRTISEGMLGLTLGCARCHDHKFDPLGQADYYSMVAMVRGLTRYAEPRYAPDSMTLEPLGFDETTQAAWERQRKQHMAELRDELAVIRDASKERLLAEHLAGLPKAVAAAHQTAPDRRTAAQRRLMRQFPALQISDREAIEATPDDVRRQANQLYLEIEAAQDSFQGEIPWALVATENGRTPPTTHMLGRGLASMAGEEVPPRFVRVLCPDDEAALPRITPSRRSLSSGRRAALADWIASESNPLTARVMVNRVWQHHFGTGLVPTPNDFGSTGLPPSHPELLDWLAAEFMDSGWSVKHLHRLILSSAAWQRSSENTGPGAEQDPGNALVWRQSLRRLDAEVIRDALVHVSGGLNPERGGRGFFPELSREAMAGSSRPGEGWEPSPPQDQQRRSIYAFLKRSMLPPVLEAFDLANPSLPVGKRIGTTTASQSLLMWNHAFVERQAERLAEGVIAEAGDDPGARVTTLFERVLSRSPTPDELALGRDHLAAQEEALAYVEPVLAFAPRVPTRVEVGFLDGLSGDDVLAVPRDGWTALKGPWGNGYNFTVELDTLRGPAALATGLEPGTLHALHVELRVGEGVTLASLLFNARAQGDGFSGLELRFDPAAATVALVRHDAPAGDDALPGDPAVLAEAPFALTPGAWHPVTLLSDGNTLWVTTGYDGTPVLEHADPALGGEGLVGTRVWGGGLDLRLATVLNQGAEELELLPFDFVDPDVAALRSLALALLNSNEFLYVD
jgi:hypothetical protein